MTKRTTRREDFEDARSAPVMRIALSWAQRSLLGRAEAAGEKGMLIRGNEWPPSDVLADWGLVEQFMRGGLRGKAAMRITERGRMWLRYAPKGYRRNQRTPQ